MIATHDENCTPWFFLWGTWLVNRDPVTAPKNADCFHKSGMPTFRSVGDASLINTAALIVTNGGVEPPRGEAERSARTTCYTPMVANPSLACHQARLSRAARQARQ